MYCENCGKELEENVLFCAYCGVPVPSSKDNLNVLFMVLSILFPIFGFVYGLINYLSNNGKPYKRFILAASISYVVMNVAVIVFSVFMMNLFFNEITNENSPLGNFLTDLFVKFIYLLGDLLEKWAEYVSRFR